MLPAHLYAHGSAVLSTLQQVAAAIGTAVVVAILSARAAGLAASGVDQISALSGGIQWGMGFGAVAGVGVLVLAFFVPSGAPEGGSHHGDAADRTGAPQDSLGDASRDKAVQV